MKTCKICGKELPINKKTFCSNECKYKDSILNQNKQVKKICEICGKEFKVGNNRKDIAKTCSHKCRALLNYKNSHEIRKCKICNTEFEVYKKAKKEFCSDKCRQIWNNIPENKDIRMLNSRLSNMNNHDGKLFCQTPEFVTKVKQTKLENHGDENYVNIEQVKQTKKERYDDEYYNNMEKNKKTKLKNHDDENYNNREKFTETMLSLYGVEHPLQNEKIKEKAVNTYYKLHGYHHALQNIDLINNIKAQYNGIGFGSKLINEKIQNTNLKLYGTINPMQNKIIYNKSIVTLKDKYGVNNAFLINPSTGKRISKVQRKLYDYILSIYPDALLEYYLTDIDLSVDIYIPSIKTVVEMYGDYWHCNPVLFDESYYHSFIKMSAKDIWTKDKIREDKITDNNYRLIIIWENQVNNIIKHKYIQ